MSRAFAYALPLNYYARLPANLTGVAPNAVERAAKRYLDPSSMVVVAVGEQASIASALESNGMKPAQTFAPADLF